MRRLTAQLFGAAMFASATNQIRPALEATATIAMVLTYARANAHPVLRRCAARSLRSLAWIRTEKDTANTLGQVLS